MHVFVTMPQADTGLSKETDSPSVWQGCEHEWCAPAISL